MMKFYEVILQTALLIVKYSLSETTSSVSFGTIHDMGRWVWNQRLHSTYLQFHPRSFVNCAIECLLRSGRCRSINYNQQMLFCELNDRSHSDGEVYNKSTGFHYSDMRTWPQSLAGKCQHQVCEKNEVCSFETGHCSVSDCGPIDFEIPENSVIQNVGHHEVGNAVEVMCNNGYLIHDKRSGERLYDGTIWCQASGYWEDVHFACLECDNNKLLIDSRARVISPLSSVINQIYVFRCTSKYKMFKDGILERRNVNVTCNKERGTWEGDNFFCKRRSSMEEDFCKQGYSYNEADRVCYKFHPEELSQRDAQQTCINEQAHLIVPNFNYTTELLQHFSGYASFYVDGVWDLARNVLMGWANNPLLNGTLTFTGTENQTCISVKNNQIQFTNCEIQQSFMCQFEICPKTAGYIYDEDRDVCYKYFAAGPHISDKCVTSFKRKTPIFPLSIPYNPKVLSWSWKAIYKKLLSHDNADIRGREAYHFFLSNLSYYSALNTCSKNNMTLAKLDTAEQKGLATNIIRNKASTVIVGMRLSNADTYKYQHTDGTSALYTPSCCLYNTDEKHCIKINRGSNFIATDCSSRFPFICADNTRDMNIEIVESDKNFEKAASHCTKLNKMLVKIPSKNIFTEVKSHILNGSSSKYYINLKLAYKPDYVYYWNLGGTVLGTRYDFQQGYTNDTKDENPVGMFNVTSGMFQLIDYRYTSPFLCQARNLSVWVDGEDVNGNPYSMNLQKWKIAAVDKNNILPIVCEIDTNDIIQKLNLIQKKPKIYLTHTNN